MKEGGGEGEMGDETQNYILVVVAAFSACLTLRIAREVYIRARTREMCGFDDRGASLQPRALP